MRRTTPAVLALLLVTSALAAVPVAMAQQTETPEPSNQTSNESVAPGAQLSGVVGVQDAELNGEVESRAYGIRVARANSDDATAGVVAAQLNTTEQRLTELEAERRELEAARANGSISEGEYRARAATLYAESRSAGRLANQTNETASGLPAATLEANGVNVTAIRTLSDRSATLTGPEVAEIARSIAGPNAGTDARPDAAENASERGDRASDGSERPNDGRDRGENASASQSEAETATSPDAAIETETDTSTDGSDTRAGGSSDSDRAGSDANYSNN